MTGEPYDFDAQLSKSLDMVKLQLLDAIRAENPLLRYLKEHPLTPEQKKRIRRMRRREWVRNHLPVVHLGPCSHEDCW